MSTNNSLREEVPRGRVPPEGAPKPGVAGVQADSKQRFNPFHTRGPIRERERFFGRDELIESILSTVDSGQNVSVVGVRQSGKTSLLFQLEEDLVKKQDPDGHLSVEYINFYAGIRTANEFWSRVVRSISGESYQPAAVSEGAEAPREATQRFVGFLEHLERTGQRVVLLLDDFDRGVRFRGLDTSFYSLLEHPVVSFVLSTQVELSDLQSELKLELLDPVPFRSFYLGGWAPEEYRQFILDKAPNLKHYEIDIEQLAGRLPVFVQNACWHYWERWKQHGEITLDDEEEIRTEFVFETRDILDRIWASLSDPERQVIKALAGRDLSDQRDLIGRSRSLDSPSRTAVGKLIRKGLIVDGALFLVLSDFARTQEVGKERVVDQLSPSKSELRAMPTMIREQADSLVAVLVILAALIGFISMVTSQPTGVFIAAALAIVALLLLAYSLLSE